MNFVLPSCSAIGCRTSGASQSAMSTRHHQLGPPQAEGPGDPDDRQRLPLWREASQTELEWEGDEKDNMFGLFGIMKKV